MIWAALGSLGLAAAGGLLQDYQQNKANKRSARALKEQAGIYNSMADTQLKAAGMYAQQAAMAANMGKANERNLRLAAARLDPLEQHALREARLQGMQRVGEGRTQFAANGVMVDSGAAARWEQDEAADAALEQLDIMQQFENQSWEYRMQANKALAEGYAAAAQHAGAAMGAAGEAYGSRLQAASSLSQAKSMKKKRWYNTIGSVIGWGSSLGLNLAFSGAGGGGGGAAGGKA